MESLLPLSGATWRRKPETLKSALFTTHQNARQNHSQKRLGQSFYTHSPRIQRLVKRHIQKPTSDFVDPVSGFAITVRSASKWVLSQDMVYSLHVFHEALISPQLENLYCSSFLLSTHERPKDLVIGAVLEGS